MGTLMHAASAVGSRCRGMSWWRYRAIRARSGATQLRGSQDRAEPDVRPLRHDVDAVGRCPHGVLTPASWMAMNATRYMHQYGVSSAGFGRAVVQIREYAASNPGCLGFPAAP